MRRVLIMTLLVAWSVGPVAAQANSAGSRAEIEAFNQKLEDATRRMDNAAMMDLWAEDDISLLPSTKPVIGKAAIAAMMDAVTTQIKGARMEKFELHCSGIEVTGDMASEWCSEHQVIAMPNGKPPFDGWGKMLLVLRRGADGKWRLLREMWNQGEAE